ncbi:protein NETWORKED 2A-like [Juglans microcarpa x Juglans regia]|uniref:protein NETWORKED 2A-like n=1 Tax=Juglans microcarpa x Juglans regia TaxID=2249226 RepID=UPI001B7F023D|nr:protein NETWORKED 2A-like [Juglans microcarpa x Juglans regia]
MLQRAASNAYSWWWASHVRTKQSRWLEQNLQDLEEKVKETLKIIDNDGDSFAQRAEMYYRRRPELINFVEEAFRAYRALAERYDHLSKELQSANRTIATVFPERAQYAMDDDEENFPGTSSPSDDPNKQDRDVAAVPKLSIPKVPDIPKKDFRSQSMLVSRKKPIKRTASTTAKAAAVPSSGLSKTEALEEIDKLHKEILALQTEKEFVHSLYKRKYEKFWEIECQITQMHKRVCDLQDEFGVGTVIEDDEARTLMVATALNSCKQTMVKLREKQEQAEEEARVERQRIEEAHKKFGTLKDEFLSKRADCLESNSPELKNIDQGINMDEEQEGHAMELPRQTIEEQIDLNSKTSLTVMELADKIDELVNKVATLETCVSTQTAMVKRLRSEIDELQAHIRSLEEEKESLVESSDVMSKKLKEMEEELRRVKNLNQSVEHQSNKLQTHFTEASSGLDNLSGKLKIVKQDEKVEDTELLQEVKAVPDAEPENKSVENSDKMIPSDEPVISEEVMAEEEEKKDDEILALNNTNTVEDENQPDLSNDLGLMPEKPKEPMQQEKDEKQDSPPIVDGDLDIETRELEVGEKDEKQDSSPIVDGDLDIETRELEVEEEEDQPIWKKLFVKGLEDREKILLEEYTSVLHNFKSVRKKLSEVENKNRDSIFELGMQIRELKSAIVSKDEVIQTLLQKLSNPQTSPYTTPEYKYIQQESKPQAASSQNSDTVSSNTNQKSLSDLFSEQPFEPTGTSKESPANLETTLTKEEENNKFEVNLDNDKHATSPVEERVRSDIDGLLEENLEFWLRFSTSVHQIQKFQSSIQDLHAELMELKHKKQEGGGKHQTGKSDIRPIYRHLREIQTELSLWMEHNALLKEELQSRFSSLCNIQDEISRISNADSRAEKTELSQYKAAKFQGEVLNMKQENNKVSDELQAGLNRVRAMNVDVEKTVAQLDDELGISASKKYYTTGARIPLRSFLFGVKLKKQRPSIFSCVNPALQKQYSDLAAGLPT